MGVGLKKAVLRSLWALAGLVLAVALWGVAIEPRLIDEESQVAAVPALPASLQGKRFAVLADFQLGILWDNDGTAARMVERILEARPAFVLLAGDFIYAPEAPQRVDEILPRVQRLLRPLKEHDIPALAVLGNHDYAQPKPDHDGDPEVAEKVRSALASIGIRVLHNEAAELASGLFLAGIAPLWPGEARPKHALASVPDAAPRVVMMHNPDSFDAIPAYAAPLAVAGHTHGGQVRIPGLPAWTWLTWVRTSHVHADGWIHHFGAPGNQLYVNRGIGFSFVPIRVNCPPELTWFELRSP